MKDRPGSQILIACFVGFLSIAALSPRPPISSGSQQPITLKPDLTIGVEDGAQDLMFGSISRIDLDGRDDIFLLDARFPMASHGAYQPLVNGHPCETFYCTGNGGNKIFVFTDQPLVAVITATAYNKPYAHPQVDKMMERYILPAVVR